MIKFITFTAIIVFAVFVLALTFGCCKAAAMAANDEMEDNDR